MLKTFTGDWHHIVVEDISGFKSINKIVTIKTM